MKPRVLVRGKRIVVDAVNPIEGYASIDGRRRRNVLLNNLAYIIGGVLNNTSTSSVDVGGISRTINTAGDFTSEATRIRWGTGTTPPSPTDYKLASETGNAISLPSIVTGDNLISILWQVALTAAISEVGISQYITDGVTAHHLYTRALVSAVAGQVLNYALEIGAPLNLNFARVLTGAFRNEPIAMTAIDGTEFTARTHADLNADRALVVVSDAEHSGSPFDLALTPYTTTPSVVSHGAGPGGFVVFVSGIFRPTSDYTIRTIGVAQSIFDTGGTGRMTLLAAMPLPSPITVPAGQARGILFRIWYMP